MSRLLLVEDDAEVRATMEEMFVRAGHEVQTAETLAVSSDLLRREPYDLVVTDGRLPDGHGLRIATLAREIGVPALIVTAYPFGVPLEWPIVQKPFHVHDLISAAEKAMSQPSL